MSTDDRRCGTCAFFTRALRTPMAGIGVCMPPMPRWVFTILKDHPSFINAGKFGPEDNPECPAWVQSAAIDGLGERGA